MRKTAYLAALLLVLCGLTAAGSATAADGCPESPDFSGPCPKLQFSPNYKVTKRFIQLKVKTTIGARIAVSGQLPGLGESPGLRKTITAGKFVPFNLEIPLVLNNHLHRIGPHEFLKVPLVARVNHVTGNISTAHLTVRIPGRFHA
jgi:hypothetical protein